MAYKVKPVASRKYGYIRNRISKAQGKAKTVGTAYLLATIALVALSCFPLLKVTAKETSFLLGFIAVVKELIAKTGGTEFYTGLAVCALLALILLVCLIKMLVKLDWLFKKKASKLYGFNRNMYAMDDMGKYFSVSFASVVLLLLGYTAVASNFMDAAVTLAPCVYALIAVGAAIHLIFGVAGGNVSVFSSLEGGIKEEKREVGNFGAIIRNIFQLAVCAALAYLLVFDNALAGVSAIVDEIEASFTATVSEQFASGAYVNGVMQLLKTAVLPLCCALGTLAFIGMTYHALGTKEFDMDGAETAGRKSFLIWSIVMLSAFVGAIVCQKLWLKTTAQLPDKFLVLAGVALAAFILELCLIRCPKNKEEEWEEEIDEADYFNDNYGEAGVYLMPEQSVSLGIEFDEPTKNGRK